MGGEYSPPICRYYGLIFKTQNAENERINLVKWLKNAIIMKCSA